MPPDHREELDRAVRLTFAAGSARVKLAMEANPPELADYEHGEGVVDFRRRRSRVAYSIAGGGERGRFLEQVTDGDMTYIRLGGPAVAWERAAPGAPGGFAPSDGAGGLLELLSAGGEVTPLSAPDEIGGGPARRYCVTGEPPRSSLRDRLAAKLGARGPARAWLEAWVDADGHVRRIVSCDPEPNTDGSLRQGSIRTTVELDHLGAPAPVQVPPADA